MTQDQMLIQAAIRQTANYESPDYLDVPIPDRPQSEFQNMDISPEQRTTNFRVFSFKKIKVERRELDGRFIEQGYEYILIKK